MDKEGVIHIPSSGGEGSPRLSCTCYLPRPAFGETGMIGLGKRGGEVM
jgi:hypothetical protein